MKLVAKIGCAAVAGLALAACGGAPTPETADTNAAALSSGLRPQSSKNGKLAAGTYLIAVDTPSRTYLAYAEVTRGAWDPVTDGWPQLAQWENDTATYTDLRFQPFTPGTVLTEAEIERLLPATEPAATHVSITDAPYQAPAPPADATSAIQAALAAAGQLASPSNPVDVIVPAGTFNYSASLSVPAYVHFRGRGGVLNSTHPSSTSVNLTGNGSGALYLKVQCNGTTRSEANAANGITLGNGSKGAPVSNTMVVGCEVIAPAGAHILATNSHHGTVAFNYAHDGYADAFHHTGTSSYAQVVGNRAYWPAIGHGDDMFAFVGYAADGDPVHHCVGIANWGRNTPARQLAAVGGGYIDFEWNDTGYSNAAGAYIAEESSYNTFGSFGSIVQYNTIDHANISNSQAGVLAYASNPTGSNPSATFSTVSNTTENTTVRANTITNTQLGVGNGQGIDIQSSCNGGSVVDNAIIHANSGWSVEGTNFAVSGNTFTP
jgi:hypothetical protein